MRACKTASRKSQIALNESSSKLHDSTCGTAITPSAYPNQIERIVAMPLMTTKPMFDLAYTGGFAVGAFNVNIWNWPRASLKPARPRKAR